MSWRASAIVTLAAALIPTALATSPSPTPPSSPSPAASAAPTSPASTGSASPGPPSPAPSAVTPGAPAVPGGNGPSARPQFSPQLEWPLVTLRADRLWRYGQGAGVTVAVIDTGIDARQPDLAGAVSATEDLTAQGTRDDGADESSDSHGTAVAGIIAARGSATGQGHMTGLAPRASLLDIRVAVQPDHVTAAAVAQGIMAAAEAGADIINVSLIVPSATPALRAAVSLARERNCLVVAAAGSPGAPQALADSPGVLIVAAAGRAGAPAAPAGASPATVSAPGDDLFSTGEMAGAGSAVDGYVHGASGSAFSAAYVSAAAALLLSADRKLSPAEAGRLLVTTARPAAASTAPPAIDPVAALDAALFPSPPHPAGSGFLTVGVGLAVAAGLAIALLLAWILAVRRRRPAEPALGSIPPSSWDQPW
jgi:subtilisin family serine protease